MHYLGPAKPLQQKVKGKTKTNPQAQNKKV